MQINYDFFEKFICTYEKLFVILQRFNKLIS